MRVSIEKIRVDGDPGAYGATILDVPGIATMGTTIEEAVNNIIQIANDMTEEEWRGQRHTPSSPFK